MAEELKSEFQCKDVTKENDPDCWSHIEWAIQEGEKAHPDWYPAGSTASAVDVQCSLFLMTHDGVADNGHNCTLPPCTAISEEMTDKGGSKVDVCSPPIVKAETEGPSIEWWGWVLIVAAVLAVGAAIAFAMGVFGSKKPKRKTRSVKPVPSEPEPTPTSVVYTMLPTVTAPPVYTYTAPSQIYEAAPVYEATQSIAVAAPQVVTGAPVYAQSVVAAPVMAAPVQSVVAAPVLSTIQYTQ